MNRLKIKLSTPEMVSDFINVCSSSKYDDCDINVYDKSNIIDYTGKGNRNRHNYGG